MLVLYGTEHCHLCEQAASLLQGLDLPYAEIDIVDDASLLARYGQSIPVLRDDFERELCWPFSGEDITGFIASR